MINTDKTLEYSWNHRGGTHSLKIKMSDYNILVSEFELK